MNTEKLIKLLYFAEFRCGITEVSENLDINELISRCENEAYIDRMEQADFSTMGNQQVASYMDYSECGEITHFDNPHIIYNDEYVKIPSWKIDDSNRDEIVFPIGEHLLWDKDEEDWNLISLYVKY